MSGAITVREARPDDFDAWLPLWEGYNAFYERAGPTAVPQSMTRLTWQRFFDAYEPMHALVAEAAGGRRVGFVHYVFHRHTTMVGPICYLQDLFTAADVRGQGVGRSLIEAVYARAKAAGSPRVYWQTHETNATARLLYDRLATNSGFIVYRREL
ncbi:MAG TPA: GNAT family N-acetyltransferase [Caulobacteraceae bacterium]|nr:GNAT family N-acetyltransferase [Caulobacteraceae bacterium]